MTSPPARVPSARHVIWFTVSLTKAICPSTNAAFTPPGCSLRADFQGEAELWKVQSMILVLGGKAALPMLPSSKFPANQAPILIALWAIGASHATAELLPLPALLR